MVELMGSEARWVFARARENGERMAKPAKITPEPGGMHRGMRHVPAAEPLRRHVRHGLATLRVRDAAWHDPASGNDLALTPATRARHVLSPECFFFFLVTMKLLHLIVIYLLSSEILHQRKNAILFS